MSATLTLTPCISSAVMAYRAAKALREEAGEAVQSYRGPDGTFEPAVGQAFVMACSSEDNFARQLACLVAEVAPPSDGATERCR